MLCCRGWGEGEDRLHDFGLGSGGVSEGEGGSQVGMSQDREVERCQASLSKLFLCASDLLVNGIVLSDGESDESKDGLNRRESNRVLMDR